MGDLFLVDYGPGVYVGGSADELLGFDEVLLYCGDGWWG